MSPLREAAEAFESLMTKKIAGRVADRAKKAGSHADLRRVMNEPSLDISWRGVEDGYQIAVGSGVEFVWADNAKEIDKWLDGIIKRAQAAKQKLARYENYAPAARRTDGKP